MTYFYKAFGLAIRSEMELPPLIASEACDRVDINLVFGKVSQTGLENPDIIKPRSQLNKTALWLDIPNIGIFLVENGRQITISPAPGADNDSIRLFLLESCLGAILQQRGELVLQGSALCFAQHCVIFSGNAGVGKSTLAAAFKQKGRQLLTDNLALFDAQGCVQPSFPQLKLWQNAANKLDIDLSLHKRVRPQIEKFAIAVDTVFCRQPMPVKTVYLLGTHNQDSFVFEEIKGMTKFQPLKSCCYHPSFCEAFAVQAAHFKRISQLAGQARVVRLTRPNHGFRVAELVEQIEQDMQRAEGEML
jgi:hypothetical protein